MGKYHIWSDSESKVRVSDELYDKVFDNSEDAYNAAVDFTHKFDGEPYRVITYVEDLEIEETIDVVENIRN